MSLTTRVLAGLVAGFALGAAVASTSLAQALPAFVRPLGALWMNALLMTVVPLVVASLILSVTAAADSRLLGAIGWRAILLLALLLFAGAILAAIVSPTLVALLPVDATSTQALRATLGATVAPGAAVPPPSLGQWVASLAPSN